MAILLLSKDLTVVSQLAGIAKQLDTELQSASSLADAQRAAEQRQFRLAVVDLSVAELAADILRSQLDFLLQAGIPVVAFGPHVHERVLAAAKAAGCQRVLSRGQFIREAAVVIARFLADRPWTR